MDRGYTRSTWAGRFMIGQLTVITNQQGGGGGGEYLSISYPFVALHVLQQHRHVEWDALLLKKEIHHLRSAKNSLFEPKFCIR